MDCDMCGKTAVAIVEVEGARMTVCAACSKHGKLVRQLPPAPVKSKSSSIAVGRPAPIREQSEISEQVRKDLPELLRKERSKRKMTHDEFAAVLQMRASTYHHFESGVMLPDVATARRMEQALKITIVQTVKTIKGEWKNDTDTARGMNMSDFIKKK